MKSIAVLVAILVIGQTLAEKLRFDNHKLYRITPKNAVAVKALKELEDAPLSGYNFWSPVTGINMPVDVMVPPYHLQDIEGMKEFLEINTTVLNENVQDLIDAEGFRPQSRAGTFGWTNYHTLEEINSWLESLARQYPTIVTLLRPGRTFEGRDIVGVKVSYSPNNENRTVFMESNIHAREWITSAVNTYILNELLTSTDSTIRSLAEQHDWYFFPVMNPDGFVFTHTNNRMWRKTRTTYSIFCIGADPNRNWGYRWMTGGASNNPCSETYAGPTPFSEVSTDTMAKYITTIAHKFVAYLDFHSYSQMLLLPYGHTTDHLDNYDEMVTIGRTAMTALSRRYGTEYVTGNIAETIYVATGASMDWVKGNWQTPIAYCYELRDKGQFGFILPAEQIIPTALETLDSVVSIFQEYYKLHPRRLL